MKKLHIGTFIISLALPVVTGLISAALTSKTMEKYAFMSKPPLSPPAPVFPIAWTILYIMMGISLYLVLVTRSNNGLKGMAVLLFILQLAMNFSWSIIFFNLEMYLFAFIWLIGMMIVVIVCAFKFADINKAAAYLLIPYILWLIFASYLNMGAYLLNGIK